MVISYRQLKLLLNHVYKTHTAHRRNYFIGFRGWFRRRFAQPTTRNAAAHRAAKLSV